MAYDELYSVNREPKRSLMLQGLKRECCRVLGRFVFSLHIGINVDLLFPLCTQYCHIRYDWQIDHEEQYDLSQLVHGSSFISYNWNVRSEKKRTFAKVCGIVQTFSLFVLTSFFYPYPVHFLVPRISDHRVMSYSQCAAGPVQQAHTCAITCHSIPKILNRWDLLAYVQTGSRKTAAFLLLILSLIFQGGPLPPSPGVSVSLSHTFCFCFSLSLSLSLCVSLSCFDFLYLSVLLWLLSASLSFSVSGSFSLSLFISFSLSLSISHSLTHSFFLFVSPFSSFQSNLSLLNFPSIYLPFLSRLFCFVLFLSPLYLFLSYLPSSFFSPPSAIPSWHTHRRFDVFSQGMLIIISSTHWPWCWPQHECRWPRSMMKPEMFACLWWIAVHSIEIEFTFEFTKWGCVFLSSFSLFQLFPISLPIPRHAVCGVWRYWHWFPDRRFGKGLPAVGTHSETAGGHAGTWLYGSWFCPMNNIVFKW